MQEIPFRQIRAVFDDKTIRVYQAYSDAIADSALSHGTFISPPFGMSRMTWIKPSFLWMMYRAGWGKKDAGQKRILAIDITREGFEWALEHSTPSTPDPTMSKAEWRQYKKDCPVRIQWDPERDLCLQPLPYRSIQIGLSNEAVELYTTKWIQRITEITDTAHKISHYVESGEFTIAASLLPHELDYPYDISGLHRNF